MKILSSLLTAAVLLMLQSGCGESEATATDADHHLEHFVPDHKPANYAEAVEQIAERSQHLSEHAGHGHGDENEQFQELVEIVDWIPELAADSDLDEAEWEKASRSANQMAALLAARRSSAGVLDLSELAGLIADQFDTLQGLVSAAGKPEPHIGHGHHHGHDHHDDHDHDHHDHDHDEPEHQDEDN